MRKFLCYCCLLSALIVFFANCNNPTSPSTEGTSLSTEAKKDSCSYCDTTLFKKIYSKDGYVLFADRRVNDSVTFDKKSAPINLDTAARMVRYFKNDSRRRRYPIVIDFDITSINKIVQELNDINTGDDEKKSFRIYLAGYDKKSLEMLYPDLTPTERQLLLNFTTAILVGRYDGGEATTAVNLGNLCPPNCVPPTPPEPNEAKSKIFRTAKSRDDVQ